MVRFIVTRLLSQLLFQKPYIVSFASVLNDEYLLAQHILPFRLIEYFNMHFSGLHGHVSYYTTRVSMVGTHIAKLPKFDYNVQMHSLQGFYSIAVCSKYTLAQT